MEYSEQKERPVPEFSGGFNVPAPAVPVQDESRQIEGVLEEDIGEMYMKMLPSDRLKFKQKGEETSRMIMRLLQEPKIKAKKIFELIKAWLKMIPGVNRFFLEQTAKIKADKILASVKDKKII